MKTDTAKTAAKDKSKKEELSEDDARMKELINHLVEKITSDNEPEDEKVRYIGQLFNEVKQTSGSGTTLPKQLKFLQPDYPRLLAFYNTVSHMQLGKHLADLLSVVSTTLAENYDRDSLRFFKAGTGKLDMDAIGDEFLLNLAGDLAADFEANYELDQSATDDVYRIAQLLLPRLFKHGHEINVVDLLH